MFLSTLYGRDSRSIELHANACRNCHFEWMQAVSLKRQPSMASITEGLTLDHLRRLPLLLPSIEAAGLCRALPISRRAPPAESVLVSMNWMTSSPRFSTERSEASCEQLQLSSPMNGPTSRRLPTRPRRRSQTDPRTSCFYARRATELIVNWIYKADSTLRLPYQDNLGALLHEPTFKQAVGEAVFNKAAPHHTHRESSRA